ncbi:MAG: hypothetical protein B6I20_09960 [Bacteroidetes bacterium 4572_117]|nr:MAG: hypothetical protein B6I20_09960 [Bacteroidetes bacterium 4572_117]
MGKYLNIGFWLLLLAYFLLVFGFVNSKRKNVLCTSINIIFNDNLKSRFLGEDKLMELIDPDENKILGKPINNLNIAKLEKLIRDQAFIKTAQVYKTIDGKLNVEIVQRKPVIRVINNNNFGFYVDSEGELMPLLEGKTIRLPVANGNIRFSPEFTSSINIFSEEYKDDENVQVLRDLSTLIGFIDSNNFWNSQIQQIYVKENNEFELVPLVGSQIIVFGGIDNYEVKFRNLKAIYKKRFLSKNWNTYKTINLKYKDQVICEKR